LVVVEVAAKPHPLRQAQGRLSTALTRIQIITLSFVIPTGAQRSGEPALSLPKGICGSAICPNKVKGIYADIANS
jgi:hypothetical protein